MNKSPCHVTASEREGGREREKERERERERERKRERERERNECGSLRQI